jgi:hypothetical protein
LLAITQVETLTRAEQRELVSRWCTLLPALKQVKYLGFYSRVTQEMFDAACAMPNLEHLFLKWSAIAHIRELLKLRRLRHLRIGSSSKLECIEELADMQNLITLNLEQSTRSTILPRSQALHSWRAWASTAAFGLANAFAHSSH